MSSSSRGPRDVYVASASHAFVSQSGLVALLKSVREHGLPEHISRQTLKRTRVQALPGDTPLGPLQSTLSLIEEQGGTLELPCISPWPLLFATLERNESFREFFEGVLASSNNSAGNPFCDEILPGDQLKATNSRKMVAFYWSLMDFGNQLGRDVLWFQFSICRASHIKKVAGQYSQLFKKICELFTKPPFDGRLGLSLPLNGPCKFGFFKVGLLLADEAALKQRWSNKGSSGLFICVFCQNNRSAQNSHVRSATGSSRCRQPLDAAHPDTEKEIAQMLKNPGDGSQDHLNPQNSAANQARSGRRNTPQCSWCQVLFAA